jgi:hypothetical protein
MQDTPQTPPPAAPGRVAAAARSLAAGAASGARLAARFAGGAVRFAWRLVRAPLGWALQVVLALLILLEEWGWQPLADLLGRLQRWRPWSRLETAITGLPPYPALAVFALPSLLLLPLKFLALFLIAKGQLVLAGLLFAGAKVVTTALVARLFMLTRPALMRIGWFAWAYSRFIPWKEAMEAYVRSSYVWRVGRVWKTRAKRAAAVQWQRLRPAVIRLREVARLALARVLTQARRLGRRIKARWAAFGR